MEELDIMEWLTADFLKKCLQPKSEHFPELEILDYTVEPAVPAGNNYGSQLIRVKVNIKTRTTSCDSVYLIVKAPITGGFMDHLKDVTDDFYAREPRFYNKFVKETYKLLKHDLVPKIYTSPDPLCIVMEDLKSVGYVMVDRCKLLDFDHCRIYVEALAKVQALSVAIHKQAPELIESLVTDSPLTKLNIDTMNKCILHKGLQCLAAYLKDEPGYSYQYGIINDLGNGDTLWNIIEDYNNFEHAFKTLNQGDPWCTNMMFKYGTSGDSVGIKLFDFQVLKFTSPVTQFVTFLWISARPEVRETRINELYHLYCDYLNRNLAGLDCLETLHFEQFELELKKLYPLVLSLICTMVPFCTADQEVDIKKILGEINQSTNVIESSFYKLYKGSFFSEHGLRLIDQATENGVFQYLADKLKMI